MFPIIDARILNRTYIIYSVEIDSATYTSDKLSNISTVDTRNIVYSFYIEYAIHLWTEFSITSIGSINRNEGTEYT